ncbi:hypothetical protein [Salsipaludibacter albus]|uniref:hypothetical protein n=1 Tax=Salsipaludibacter albus TaxID=2849650 RepID=UPI001EE412F9|nr:hypothetical protein [Salsipaludibacter albus]MBY5161335.1 hypothetical protein [Salsipaludibacter albus]
MSRPRVLSYPPRHDYVDQLHGEVAMLVHRDEPWPRLPHFHDPGWLDRHADDWDLAHFHFGWEQYPAGTFERVLEAHLAHGTPVVWTAHDLRNPHTRDEAHDAAHLDLLAQHATRVVTLTPGAATRIAERWGRVAVVVPHPPILPVGRIARWRRRRERSSNGDRPLRLFLLAKSLRSNLDWRTPLEVVGTWNPHEPPVRLDMHLHAEAPDRVAVERAANRDHVHLTVGPRLDHRALCRRIAAADVLVLPYAWGTHSGLLELATDLGVAVVATDVGHYGDQAPCRLVPVRDGRVDPERLRAVLCAIALDGPAPAVPIAERIAAREGFLAAHAAVYAAAVHDARQRGTAVS